MSWAPPMRLCVVILFATLACADGDAGDTDEGAFGADQEAPVTPRPDPAGPADGGEGIELAAVDHSGISGRVESVRDDEAVTITLSVEGLEPGLTYPAHVHQGRCVAGGPVLVSLEEIVSDGSGTARASTRIAADQLPEAQQAFVQVHGQDGSAVACADLAEATSDAPAGGG
jgi:hypothetical protein